jgi:hypothetical protein
MMLIVVLLMVVSIVIKLPQLGLAGFVGVCIFPIVYEKRLKKLFSQKVDVRFSDSGIKIVSYSRYDESVSGEEQIGWNEMQSYRFSFTAQKDTVLSLGIREGGRKRWNFRENKTITEAIGSESIFNAFRAGVSQYNSEKEEHERIELVPGFWNSKAGTTLLYTELVVLVIGFIIHLTAHPNSSVFTLLTGLSVLTRLFIQRKQEKKLFDRINKL